MSTEGWSKAVELGMGVMRNPQVLRALQNVPGATAEAVSDALETFGRAARAGLLGPDIKNKVIYGGPPVPAGPIPTRRTEVQQLPLALRTRGGRPVTGSAPRPTPRNAETIRLSRQPSVADTASFERAYRQLRPGEAPGQQNLFAAPEPQFRTTPRELPSSEAAKTLYAQQPGTYNAIQALADRASAHYGVPVTFDDLVGPKGTLILRELEYGPLAIQKAAGGGMVPPSSAGRLAEFEPGGPLTVSPGGALGRPAPATASADNVIDLDYSVIRDLPQGMRGAVPSATTDLGKTASGARLSREQLIALGLGAGAVGGGTLASYLRGGAPQGQPEQLTEEQIRGAAAQLTEQPMPESGIGLREAPVMPATSVAGQIGSGPAVIRQDDRESNYRQARANAIAAALGKPGAPKEAGQYDKISKYYAERERYAKQPEMRAELAAKAAALEGTPPNALQWAAANPTLAYELLKRANSRPELSQQTPQPQGATVGTQLGDNSQNNMVGNAQAAAATAVEGTAGAADLEDATRPLIRPALNRVPLGGRFVPLGGSAAYPTVPFV